jgi:hypothetical protein
MTSLRALPVLLPLLAALLWAGLSSPAVACPFCTEQKGATLIEDYKQATLVLYGKFINPKLEPEERSDLVIEKVVYDPKKIVANKKVVTLPKYVQNVKSKYLIFCDVYKGKLDPYRGVELAGDADVVKYLQGAVDADRKDKSIGARLRYCFDYLDSPELEISLDAYREFANADYKDYKDMAKKLPADKIAGWLKKAPAYRYGLYASLLGHCGTARHAELLRKMLDDPEKRAGSGVDGLLVAYTMLDKAKGYSYLRALLGNAKEEFTVRYSGLKAVNFLWEVRPDLVKKKDLLAGLGLLLEQPDIADFAIEDLRKWKVWEMADKVLALTEGKYRKSHDAQVIRRSILRYALSCPKKIKKAAAYVEAERKRDKEYVEEVEDLLKLENDTPAKK